MYVASSGSFSVAIEWTGQLAESAGGAAGASHIAIRATSVEVVASVVGEDVVQRCPRLADAGLEFSRGADGCDLAVVHDGDALAEAVGLFHVVRREEDSHANLL